jgi:PAS domain S-box-containing protein
MTRDSTRAPAAGSAPSTSLWWAIVGLAVAITVAVIDTLADEHVVLISLLLCGPLVAAIGARVRDVIIVGACASGLAIALGARRDILFESDHIARIAVVIIGSFAAVALAHLRQARDVELGQTRPAAADAQRLRVALDAGEMGTWRWELATGRVMWDTRLELLFGLEPGEFDGTFEMYRQLLHPEDRERVTEAVDEGMRTGAAWQFDHRAVWRDGSVHWLEGRGEPERDEAGSIIGATGVTINIDSRIDAEADRAKLLEAERAARAFAEQLSDALQRLTELSMALSGAANFDEVADAMVRHGMHALNAQYGWFGLIDPAGEQLVTRAHEGYPEGMIQPYGAIPLDMDLPATSAFRSGMPMFVETAAEQERRFADLQVAHPAFVAVPITTTEDARGVLTFGYAEERTFSPADRRYVAAVIEACAQALRRAALFEAELSTRSRLRTVVDFSEQMAMLDDPDEVLDVTARFAAHRIGRFASTFAVAPDGTPRRAAIAHINPVMESVMHDLVAYGVSGESAVRQVIESGDLISIQPEAALTFPPDIDEEALRLLDTLRPMALVAVPMTVSGRTRGVVVIGDDRPPPAGTIDLELARDIGRRGASALERAQLWRASQEQLETEHRNVQVLQKSIVPEQLPKLDGAQLAAAYRPADTAFDVGGDWYDAFETADGQLVVVLGDVAGHGIESAALMGRVRNAMRAYAMDSVDPASLLNRTHQMLFTFDPGAMVTAVVACYDPTTRQLAWSRAGHPPPLLSDANGVRYLEEVNGVPLGTIDHVYKTVSLVLEPGSLLVLYTDGLIERRDAIIDEGLTWLSKRVGGLRDASVSEVCQLLASESFAPSPSDDDLCVLALRIPN